MSERLFHVSVAGAVLFGLLAIVTLGSHMAGISFREGRADARDQYVGTRIQLPRGVTAEVTDVGFGGVDVVSTDLNGNSTPVRISWGTYNAAIARVTE